MFVIDKKYLNQINDKIPFDIRNDYIVKTKSKDFILPTNVAVTKADRYVQDGVGIESLEIEIYLTYGDDTYKSFVIENDKTISLFKYNPVGDINTLGELIEDILVKSTSVELLYDDSNKLTRNKIAFVFTMIPENVPEELTFFISKELLKDIRSGAVKTNPWVKQLLE